MALPIWNGRVSPVFDVAKRLLVVDVDNGAETGRREEVLDAADPARRAGRVADLGIDVLICGAISWPLETMLTGGGVQVIGRTCGSAEEILQAFLSGQLTRQAFLMPGCGRRRGRFGRRWRGGRAW